MSGEKKFELSETVVRELDVFGYVLGINTTTEALRAALNLIKTINEQKLKGNKLAFINSSGDVVLTCKGL